jgi:tetratricopeptide (TPR) repeat protein
MSFKKLNNIVGWLVFAIATFTYVATIEPTASFWDCGEYIACAFKLEVGHPPGAPFFLIVGRFFALLAGGSPEMAGTMINIMSALCSSFTILFLFWTITRLAVRILVGNDKHNLSQAQQWAVLGSGAVGALAYTFSDSFWFSAVEGEVYAMSSFFTAIVFWAILKWDEEDSVNPTSAMRWLVLIAYLMGLSIGVHLLNLLVIPAICFIYYYKKYKFEWKTFIITGLISLLLLGGIQNIMIPKIVKFAADYEIFFVNKLGMGFNIGSIVYFLLLGLSIVFLILYTVNKKESHYKIGFYSAIVFTLIAVISGYGASAMITRLVVLGGLLYGINTLKNKNLNTLNVVLVSFATLLIGYSSFFILIIRSQANPPMDENDPENAITMLSYLNREQYGDWPLTYGQYYNAPTKSQQYFKDGEPVYAKDEKTKKYKITDDRKKSIPVYEEEYCTVLPRMWSQQSNHEAAYRYWGDIQNNHKKKVKMNEQSGQMEEVQIPTFVANIKYLINYQIKYMYLRYFAWNFIGRQNDIQGLTGNPLEGNWKTGIKALDDVFLDTDTSFVPHAASNNKADNSFYAIPFILGLLGFFFQFKKNKADTWVVGLLFLLTGFAIVFYLNQYPYQPRERDYAYAASFYAYAIWIGFGVLFLFDFLSKKTNVMASAAIATIIGLIGPSVMAAQGWDDHDRSLRTMSRDFAVNYLNSCAPNAILFTNGDNDTFPLWYAQEVEGIRTDVRVVNLSLLQTDWYINQMRRAAYESAPVPFTIPAEKYVQGTRDVVYIMDKGTGPMNLKKAIDFVESDDISNKLDYGNKSLDYIPTNNFYIPVDSMAVMKNKVIDVRDTARLVKNIKWNLNRSYLTKNDLMVLDLLAHNDWTRPIYFAVTTGADAYLGLEEYFQLEGLAYRFVPIKHNENEVQQGGRVNTKVMYDNIMNKFAWGGLDKPGVNLDENCTRMASNMRMQMATLAAALISKGQKEKAKQVLDYCLTKMPDENVRYEATLFSVAAGYYQVGDYKKAMELSDKLFDVFENDIKVYKALKPNHRAAFGREMNQAKEIMRRLTMLAEQFKQTEYAEKLTKRLMANVPMEELMPENNVEN